MTTASFAMYTFSLAVLVQVFVLVSLSGFADYGAYPSSLRCIYLLVLPRIKNGSFVLPVLEGSWRIDILRALGRRRKQLLLALGYTGATASMLFLAVEPKLYAFAPILVIVGVACLGSSFAVLNSFLPLLVKNHESLQDCDYDNADSDGPRLTSIRNDRDDLRFENSMPDRLVVKDTTQSTAPKASIVLSTSISSKGVALGYMAAVSVQVLSILLLLLLTKTLHVKSSTLPLRLILFIVGVWWFLFTIPTARYLRSRPGPPLPYSSQKPSANTLINFFQQTLHAWFSLYHTFCLTFHLHRLLLFLLAWFLLSDAIATVAGTALLFARTVLHLSTLGIAALSITTTLSAIAGAASWPRIQSRYFLSPIRTIIAMIALMAIIPIYALLPYLPPVKHLGFLGLQHWTEIYPLAVMHGFAMGGLSSYCRAFYSGLIPAGKEAAFFALFAVTDKGSSAIGPAIVGRIVDKTGDIRAAFWFLAALVLSPIFVLAFMGIVSGGDGEGSSVREGLGGADELVGVEMRDRRLNDGSEEGEGLLAAAEEEERIG